MSCPVCAPYYMGIFIDYFRKSFASHSNAIGSDLHWNCIIMSGKIANANMVEKGSDKEKFAREKMFAPTTRQCFTLNSKSICCPGWGEWRMWQWQLFWLSFSCLKGRRERLRSGKINLFCEPAFSIILLEILRSSRLFCCSCNALHCFLYEETFLTAKPSHCLTIECYMDHFIIVVNILNNYSHSRPRSLAAPLRSAV